MNSKLAIVFFYRPANKYSLIALAGVMESDPELSNIDLYFESSENHLLSQIKEIQKHYEQIIIAISLFSFQVISTRKTLEKIKKLNFPNIRLLAGGPHATGNPYETLQLGFDAVVVGEGEQVFYDIVKNILNTGDIQNPEGLFLFDIHKQPIFCKPAQYIDLNRFLPLNKKYHKFGPIEITRGCPYGCTYCQTPRIFGRKVRHRSLDTIMQCVEIMKFLKFRDIRFTTPNFFSWQASKTGETNIQALHQMFYEIRKILPQGRLFIGSFPSEVRPENVTENTIKLVKEFGSNDNLVVGAQSGSQRILDIIHRNHTVEDVFHSVELIIKNGFRANVDVIFGLPGENEKDELLTAEMIEKLIKMGAYIHAHTFMPLIQTPLEQASPGKIGETYKKLLNRWVSTGKIYGQWEAQQNRL